MGRSASAARNGVRRLGALKHLQAGHATPQAEKVAADHRHLSSRVCALPCHFDDGVGGCSAGQADCFQRCDGNSPISCFGWSSNVSAASRPS
jgi:hypothetical protein